MAALIRDSATRNILLTSGWKFFYPALSLKEIDKYKYLIIKKSRLSSSEYKRIFSLLISRIHLLPFDKLKPFFKEANDILGKIDRKDVIFAAAALSLENDGIWSNDSDFQEQKKIKIWNTNHIIEMLNI